MEDKHRTLRTLRRINDAKKKMMGAKSGIMRRLMVELWVARVRAAGFGLRGAWWLFKGGRKAWKERKQRRKAEITGRKMERGDQSGKRRRTY